MAERMTIIDGEKVSYKGLFDFKELYNVIDAFLWQKGFDKRIRKNEEQVSTDGKYVNVIMQPWKKITEYIKHEIKMVITVHHAKDEIREIDGVKKKLTNGVVEITFYGFLVTDYEGRWEQRAEYFFLRTIFDTFIYKMQNQNSSSMLKTDVKMLKGEIEAFLNLHRFT
jgi:hypothetical protein